VQDLLEEPNGLDAMLKKTHIPLCNYFSIFSRILA